MKEPPLATIPTPAIATNKAISAVIRVLKSMPVVRAEKSGPAACAPEAIRVATTIAKAFCELFIKISLRKQRSEKMATGPDHCKWDGYQ